MGYGKQNFYLHFYIEFLWAPLQDPKYFNQDLYKVSHQEKVFIYAISTSKNEDVCFLHIAFYNVIIFEAISV